MLAFNFNSHTNTHVFCEGQIVYWDVQIPATIPDKSSALIYLIRNLLQSKDAQYFNIYKAICFLEPAMSKWTKTHFQNFLGRHDADEYSSDSDQDESDASQYQDDDLSGNILNFKGGFARDSLETRIKTLATKARDKKLSENSVKGFNDSAAERQSYFPNNSVVDNFGRVDPVVEYELRLINEALAADINYQVMLGFRPVASLNPAVIYIYQDQDYRLFYSVNSPHVGDVFDIVFDDLSREDIAYIIDVWKQHAGMGKNYLEDTRAISIILASTWKKHHTKENFKLKFFYENEKKYIHITNERFFFNHRITRSYYLPLFRGISYLVDRWGASARRKHRRLRIEDEFIHYSESIVKTIEDDFYQLDDYLHIDQATLHENARKLKESMLELKRSENTTEHGGAKLRAFDNLLYQFQYGFSNGIENFLKLIQQFNRDYPGVFPNDGNPFVPFGHLPFHAVKYAFGEKNPYKDFSLLPLWDARGKPRKPHIGKLYIFLHKLEDFLNFDEPNNVPFLSQNYGVTPSFDVAPEYEISFLSFTKKERLFKQRIIRYPNFNYDYEWFNTVWMYVSSAEIPNTFDPKVIILQEKKQGNGYRVTAYWIGANGYIYSNSHRKSDLKDISGFFPNQGYNSNSLDLIEKVTAKFNIIYYKQDKYLAKYGLTWNLFILFKNGICNIDTQKETTEVLREWLLLFHAIKAMHEAQSEISRIKHVCIFRHPDGAYRVSYPHEGSYVNSEVIRKSEHEARIHLQSSENRLLIQAEGYSDKRRISLFSPSLHSPCKTPLNASIKRQSLSSSLDRIRNSESLYSSVSSKSSQEDSIDSFAEAFERMLSIRSEPSLQLPITSRITENVQKLTRTTSMYDYIQILSDTAGNPSQVPDKAIYLKKWTESNRIIITVYWQEVDQVKCMSHDEADIPHIVSQLPVMSDISQNTHLIHSVISEFIFSQTTVNSEVARAGSYTLSEDGTSYSNQTRNISINLFPSDEQFLDIQEISDLAKAKKESLLLALQQEKAGHRFIEGWQLQDVEDKGNCFYLAIIKQMESINHSFLETVPAGTSPHDSLRLRIQGRNFTGNVHELTRTTALSNSIAAYVRQDTKGEGDCAFHAALGRWNPSTQQFEIDDIAGKRKKVADAVRTCKPDFVWFPLLKAAIMTLVMDHNTSMKGQAYQRLKAAYQNYEISDNQLIAEKWAIFEPKLLQYPAIIQHIEDFIQTYSEKQPRDPSIIDRLRSSLRDRFFTCQNEGGDTLRALIMSIPELEKAYLDYKKLAQGINFDDFLNGPALLNEYAVFITTPRRWILPCELAIIAHVFDISIVYYTMHTAAPDHFNPGRPTTVAVCFNGRDHYERMADENELSALHILRPVSSFNPTALSSSTRVSDRGGADGNAKFSRHDSTTDGATFSVELEKSKVVRVNSCTFPDGEWANAPEIFEVVRQFRAVVAIVDTRRPDLGFRCYYLNAQGEVNETHNPDEIPTERPIFRLAFTGNHYLSTQSHPSLDIGAIRRSFTDPWISFITSSTNAGFWGGQMTRLYEKHHKKSSCVIS